MRHDKSDPDLSISNGTCYYDVGEEATDDYIPCVGITYLAGCTDSEYKASSCPSKNKLHDQQWVGLANCKDDDNVWAGCKESGDVPGTEIPSFCTCSKGSELFTDKPSLDNIAVLPTSLGGSISWYSGMKPVLTTATPTVTKPATTTVTSPPKQQPSYTRNPISDPSATQPSTIVWNQPDSTSPPAQASTTPSTVVPPSNQPDSSANTPTGTNLSTAAQAGIGIGAGFGAILLGGLLYLVFFLRKRQGLLRGNAKAQSDLPGDAANGADPTSPTCTELAADELKRASELPGSPAASELPSPTGPRQSFRAYNPQLHGNYAQNHPGKIDGDQTLSTEGGSDPSISPMSPSSVKAEKGSPENEKDDATKRPTGPIYELEG